MPRTSLLYRALARTAFGAIPLASPFFAKLARGLAGRRGSVAKLAAWAAAHRDHARPLIWCHAPSVGEGLQARAVLEILRARHPGWQIAFTHFSPSAEASAARQPADVHAYLPPDLPGEVDAALDALAPTALVFVKLDVWPELACRASERGVAVLLVAGTVSPVSGRTGWPARDFTRAGYNAIARAGAISDADAARLGLLGVAPECVTITGDPRFDSVMQMVASARATAPILPRVESPTMVAGSTWGADDAVVLEAFAGVRRAVPTARLILAPHEPTPGHLAAVDVQASRAGLPRPERLADARGKDEFIVVDRVGVLAQLYGIGDMAYVGGGFGRAGLHSVLEPAAWGVPVIFGPNWQSSREAGLLQERGGGVALPARSAAFELTRIWLGWISDERARWAAGEAASDVVRAGVGGAIANAEIVETAISNCRVPISK